MSGVAVTKIANGIRRFRADVYRFSAAYLQLQYRRRSRPAYNVNRHHCVFVQTKIQQYIEHQ